LPLEFEVGNATGMRCCIAPIRFREGGAMGTTQIIDKLIGTCALSWSKRADRVACQNFDATGQHTPGPGVESVRLRVDERDVPGFGSRVIATDAGQADHPRPPYPCHCHMHGSGRCGLQCLTNLDRLPPTGAVLICLPLTIRRCSASPLGVLALMRNAAP
jgi:kynurenine formamidase